MNLLFEAANPDQPIKMLWNLCDWLIAKLSLAGDSAAAAFLGAAILCIAIPYLIGSISPAIIISRRQFRDDVREHGSGNAGTTNMLRSFGKRAAVVTILLDFAKAILATLLGRLLWGEIGQALAGFFVGFGHMFPIYYRFRGGKGVACYAMVALVISPLTFLGILFTFLVVLIGTHYVSLASIMASLMFPMFMQAFAADKPLAVAMAVMAAIFVVFMHRENIRRLWHNEENKFDFSQFRRKKKAAADDSTAAPAVNQASDTEQNTDTRSDEEE